MEKKLSTADQAGTRETRPLDDTVEGEAVIPELDEEEARRRLGGKATFRGSEGGGGIRPAEDSTDDLLKDEDDTDGNV